ncbi:MAG: omega-amidase [Patiriisocius sp.]|jgi:omega-amidase
MKKLNVALLQSDLKWENKSENLDQFDIKLSILQSDVDLVVLPEMFNTGFSMNTNLAEGMNGPSVVWMLAKAKALTCHVVGSLIVKENEKIYNRLLCVSPDGDIATYDKRHLFTMAEEDKYFDAGDVKAIVDINGFKVNLQVCYDLRFPVWIRNKYANGKHDYDVIIYVANWPEVRSKVWRNLLQARAAENMVYVIGVNRVGVDGTGKSYNGDSMTVDPWGSILVQSKKPIEETLHASLDMELLQDARSKFPVANDADNFKLLG